MGSVLSLLFLRSVIMDEELLNARGSIEDILLLLSFKELKLHL